MFYYIYIIREYVPFYLLHVKLENYYYEMLNKQSDIFKWYAFDRNMWLSRATMTSGYITPSSTRLSVKF